MQPHHSAWLSAHPERTEEWLRARLREGFHVHHLDGDHSNNSPANLVLIDGADHMRLHTGQISAGIKWWRKSIGRRGNAAMRAKMASRGLKSPERKRTRIKRDEPLTLLNPEATKVAAHCLAAGGSIMDAARKIEPLCPLSWKQRMAAIRREVIAV